MDEIPSLVRAGKLTSARIETSFRRLMLMRLRLGMFDPPAMNRQNYVMFSNVESSAHLTLARRAAASAMCLYSNRDGTLPLSALQYNYSGAMLVAGFSADDGDLLQGNYARHTDIGGRSASIISGLAETLTATGAPSKVPR